MDVKPYPPLYQISTHMLDKGAIALMMDKCTPLFCTEVPWTHRKYFFRSNFDWYNAPEISILKRIRIKKN